MPDGREYQSVVADAEQAARAGDFARADARLREALQLQESALGSSHPDLASTLNNLAVVCESLGHLDDAEQFYRRAYAIASSSRPPTDPLVVTSRENLKDFCTAQARAFDDWPDLGRVAAGAAAAAPPAQAAPPAPASATPPAASSVAPAAVHVPATASRRGWPRPVMGLVAVLALIVAVVAGRAWRADPPVEHSGAAAPAPPQVASPAVAAGPTAPPVSATAPRPTPNASAAPDTPAEPVTAAPAAPATASAPPAAATRRPASAAALPAGVRVVIADVCASLSTTGPWRCEPLPAPAAPGRAVFYTRIASPAALRIEHRWYHGTTLRQTVPLSIAASPTEGYRTFSRQTLAPGRWRVELRASDGTVLHEAAFDVQ